MSKSKKILSIVLALVMALGVLAIGSFAATTTPTGTVTITADSEQVDNSETVTITVKASSSEDFYAGPMSLPITYDTTLFSLGTVTVADVFGAGTTEKITNTATAGKVIVTIIPKTDGTPVAPNLTTETVLATITFTSDAAETGTGTFAIDPDQKTTTNPTGKFYIGSFDGSNPKTAELTTMGQTLNTVPVEVAVGASEPELILTATGEANGIKIDTHKTFGGTYAGAVYGFPQTANNTFMNTNYLTTNLTTTTGALVAANFGRSIGASGYGTGTTITVGSKVYVVIIFGDVDGNGLINTSDFSAAKGAITNASSAPNNSVKRMAANCSGTNAATLHLINTQDASAIKYYIGTPFSAKKFGATATVATISGAHFAANTYYQ
jgi:nitrogen regulatory protein PII